MSIKYAQILDGNIVGNLIEGPDGYPCPEGWVECPINTEPGAVYTPPTFDEEGTELTAAEWQNPPPPVPQSVSRFQARASLLGAGLLESVELAIAGADPVAQLAWADALEFRRYSPTVLAISAGLGLTDEQLDELFRTAVTIEA